MGVNYYRGSWGHGHIKDGIGSELKMLNHNGLQLYLHAQGIIFIDIARIIFTVHSQHDPRPPIFYNDSFRVSRIRSATGIRGVAVINSDPTAEWVEFGAHAGGKTRVLRYRVFGRTADAMELRGRL